MKKITLLLVSTMTILVCLTGCMSEKDKFVGTWKTTVITYTFFSDGTLSVNGISGTYEIKDDKLVISSNDVSGTFDYSFSNDDTTLTLVDVNYGVTTTLQKETE